MARAGKAPAEYSQERVLAEVAAAKKTLVELRQKLHEARQGHLPPEYLSDARDGKQPKGSPEEIAKARETQVFIDATETEIRRLEGELQKAWEFFGGLSPSAGRVKVPSGDVQAEIAALQERRRTLDRRAGTFKEDEHDRIDAVLAFHRDRVGAILASWPIGAGEIIEAATSWSWLDPSFAEALHKAVDAHEFPAGTRAAWKAELQTIARGISRREAELQLRASELEAREAEQKKAAAEQQLAAIET